MIRVENLTKDYGSRRAISNVNFEAEQGEVVGFRAERCRKDHHHTHPDGLLPPTDGTATVAGYDVVNQSLEVRRRVGYLPETVPLYTDMTTIDYLQFMADLRHIPNSRDRAHRR